MKQVIAIFDVGKTNKKLFLFDKQYNVVFEKSARFNETIDEDGDVCENVETLRQSLLESLQEVLDKKEFDIRAVNFAAYGASFVYLDKKGKVLTPLYNYLKEYPADLHKNFYAAYGDETAFSHRTASPLLGSLNSGLQLYRLKYKQPAVFKSLAYALHLPQYLSFLVTGKMFSDITSIGSHTGLWNFTENKYDHWVKEEKIEEKLAPVHQHHEVIKINFQGHSMVSGIGLHDSSAALIPYLVNFHEPFVLISTGTWSITLNPFNHSSLSTDELQHDCLCYLTYEGNPVKASRLFAGYEHDEQVKLLAAYYQKPLHYYKQVGYDLSFIRRNTKAGETGERYDSSQLNRYFSYEEAYHHLMLDITQKQFESSAYVMTDDVKRIFVDGGFSKNLLYMNMLATFYPGKEVYAATIAQSTALGAALAIHTAWNDQSLPANMIDLKYYSSGQPIHL